MDLLTDISYLKTGTPIQQEANCSLEKLDIFNILQEYTPILAGTIPLGIDIKGSDLDIICEAQSLSDFESFLIEKFGQHENFKIYLTKVRDVDSLVCQFFSNGFEYEIFGQDIKTVDQYAVVHMVIEKRILEILGQDAVDNVRELKKQGLKTEPAFCKYLNIKGDPYDELALLSKLSEKELRSYLSGCRVMSKKK